MGLRDFTIYHLLQHNARHNRDAPAAISVSRTVSHGQLLERVDQLATGLSAHGIARGDRVCILAQNSIEYLELYGACARTGAIAYPINWRLTASEVQEVVALADPQMLVVGAGHLEQLEGLDQDRSHVRVRALIGDGEAEGFIPLADLYQEAVEPGGEVGSADPFMVVSTAAVAGVPRGAVLTHNNLIIAGYELITALGLTAQDRCLAALPLFHIMGLGLALGAIQAGGANVVLETFDPGLAVQLMDEHRVTLIADFSPILQMLLDARQQAGARWERLRYVVGLDAPDTIQQLHAETAARFVTGFGQSETTGMVTIVPVEEKPGSAGRPVAAVRLRCVDEAGADVPTGEPGEIVVQGPLVFDGYWRDPAATEFTFRHGWHHTGDVGRLDADGYLYYVGRKPEKELIKSGGENVYPAEVEHVIEALPEVAAVCVIGVPHPRWGEAVKAVVELAPNATLSGEQVIRAVAREIASYKKPQVVDFVTALPRTDGGAIDREAVKAAHS